MLSGYRTYVRDGRPRDRSGKRRLLVPRAALHDPDDVDRVLEHGDVAARVAVDHEQVGEVAVGDAAELVAASHELGAVDGGPPKHVERRDAGVAHVDLELVGV